jgi:peptidoglycan/LPS O-acetylase OafA/YrhL
LAEVRELTLVEKYVGSAPGMKESTSCPGPLLDHEINWRTHIDGMRAISVLAVLLYHVGFKKVGGGFVGVDVFFVISGFLISKVIYDDIASNGHFSVLQFYQRRICRIIPAFVVVTVATLVAGWFLFSFFVFAQLGNSVIYSSVFAANIFFYLSSNYFGLTSNTQPLLHYWSLGVEEQFYIVFPLIVLAVQRIAPRSLGGIILAFAVASLGLAEYYVRTEPTAAFYLAPQRAWELMAGSILALPAFPYPTNRILREVMAALGVGLILFAVRAYSTKTHFPGFAALVPVMGASLILWGCDRGRTVTGALLSIKPLRLVGLWSYSIYMIHWPLIVYARQLSPTGGMAQSWLIMAAAIVLGFISYRFVETPFRKTRWVYARTQTFSTALACLVVLVGAGACVYESGGFAARWQKSVNEMLAYRSYDIMALYRQGTCFIGNQPWSGDSTSTCLHPSHPSVLLWGDSHSAALYKALDDLFRPHGISLSQASASSCSPVLGSTNPNNPYCPAFVDTILDWISRTRPDVVILAALWSVDDDVVKKLDATVDRLTQAGSLVILVGNTPFYQEAVPEILAKRLLLGDPNTLDENGDMGSDLRMDYYLGKRYAANDNVIYISSKQTLCMNTKCPLTAGLGIPIDWDGDHFTREGAELAVQRMFTAEIRKAIFDRLALQDRLGQ